VSDLITKIRAAAIAYPGLTALLGGSAQDSFRWYNVQLNQAASFPAVVVTLISSTSDYAFPYRMTTNFNRVQFEIWAGSPASAAAVADQLYTFLDQFNAYGIAGLIQNANFVISDRQGIYAPTQPPQYQRIIDARVFDNSAV
jgi:hypothetical protein